MYLWFEFVIFTLKIYVYMGHTGYISKDFDFFVEKLKTNFVTFEYKKKDGSIRRASGTMNEDYLKTILKPREPEYWKVEQKVIDVLLKEHNYNGIIDYAEKNKLTFIGVEGEYYVFNEIKENYPKRSIDNSKQKVYFDLSKGATRSFLIENFIGVINYQDINYEKEYVQ